MKTHTTLVIHNPNMRGDLKSTNGCPYSFFPFVIVHQVDKAVRACKRFRVYPHKSHTFTPEHVSYRTFFQDYSLK